MGPGVIARIGRIWIVRIALWVCSRDCTMGLLFHSGTMSHAYTVSAAVSVLLFCQVQFMGYRQPSCASGNPNLEISRSTWKPLGRSSI